jgi:hypothetical protein
MESAFIEWLVGQVGVAGIAGLSLYLLNRTYQDALRRELDHAATARDDKLKMISVLEENARAMTGLQRAIDSLCDARRHPGA